MRECATTANDSLDERFKSLPGVKLPSHWPPRFKPVEALEVEGRPSSQPLVRERSVGRTQRKDGRAAWEPLPGLTSFQGTLRQPTVQPGHSSNEMYARLRNLPLARGITRAMLQVDNLHEVWGFAHAVIDQDRGMH
jgi:hypothetical protein